MYRRLCESWGSAELIYRWRREQNNNPSLTFSGNGNAQLTPEQQELSRIKKELKDVKMERDILKKAVSIFSVSNRKSTKSVVGSSLSVNINITEAI